MDTPDKDSVITIAETILLGEIKKLKLDRFRNLKKKYLAIVLYDSMTNFGAFRINALYDLCARIEDLIIKLNNNQIVPAFLYRNRDHLTPYLNDLFESIKKLPLKHLKPLSYSITDHLVRLVELFCMDNPQIKWTNDFKTLVGGHLEYFAKARKGLDSDLHNLGDPSAISPQTYSHYLRKQKQDDLYCNLIDEEFKKCLSFVVQHATSYAAQERKRYRQIQKDNKSYPSLSEFVN
jgi:hypothetical protein